MAKSHHYKFIIIKVKYIRVYLKQSLLESLLITEELDSRICDNYQYHSLLLGSLLNWRCSRKFQSLIENYRIFQNVLENSRVVQNSLEACGRMWKPLEYSRDVWNLLKPYRIVRKSMEESRRVQRLLECVEHSRELISTLGQVISTIHCGGGVV